MYKQGELLGRRYDVQGTMYIVHSTTLYDVRVRCTMYMYVHRTTGMYIVLCTSSLPVVCTACAHTTCTTLYIACPPCRSRSPRAHRTQRMCTYIYVRCTYRYVCVRAVRNGYQGALVHLSPLLVSPAEQVITAYKSTSYKVQDIMYKVLCTCTRYYMYLYLVQYVHVLCTRYYVHSTMYILAATCMYIVHLYDVLCTSTRYYVHCTMYDVPCTLYYVRCTLYLVLCTMYMCIAMLYILERERRVYTMYYVHRRATMYIVLCTMYID